MVVDPSGFVDDPVNEDGGCSTNLYILGSAGSFGAGILAVWLSCIKGEDGSGEVVFYPYYANCCFAIIFAMGFTMIGMIVKNLVHYCRFGVLRQSNFYDDHGNSRLGSFFACIVAS